MNHLMVLQEVAGLAWSARLENECRQALRRLGSVMDRDEAVSILAIGLLEAGAACSCPVRAVWRAERNAFASQIRVFHRSVPSASIAADAVTGSWGSDCVVSDLVAQGWIDQAPEQVRPALRRVAAGAPVGELRNHHRKLRAWRASMAGQVAA